MSVTAFGAGFFGALNARLDEDRQYIRDQRQKRRDYLMTTGTEIVNKTKAQVDQAIAMADQLKAYGMTDTNIQHIIDVSGPMGLQTTLEVISKNGIDIRDSNAVNDIIKGAVAKDNPVDYRTSIETSFGLFKTTPNPVERERKGFFASLGVDPDEAVSSVYSETFAGGYTGADLMRLSASTGPAYKGAAPINYGAIPVKISAEQARLAFDNINIVTDSTLQKKITELNTAITSGEDVDVQKATTDKNFLEEQAKLAPSQRDYAGIFAIVPELRADMLALEERAPGSLKSNDLFKVTTAYDVLFAPVADVDAQTADALGGVTPSTTSTNAPDAPTVETPSGEMAVSGYNEAKVAYPDMPPVEEIKTYTTEDDAIKSGDKFVIVGGKLLVNEEEKPEEVEVPVVDDQLTSVVKGVTKTYGEGAGATQVESYLKAIGMPELADDKAFVESVVTQADTYEEPIKVVTDAVTGAVDTIVKKIAENQLPDVIEPTQDIEDLADALYAGFGKDTQVPLPIYLTQLEELGRTDILEDEEKLDQFAFALSLKILEDKGDLPELPVGPTTRPVRSNKPSLPKDDKRVPGRAIVQAFKNYFSGIGETDPGKLVRASNKEAPDLSNVVPSDVTPVATTSTDTLNTPAVEAGMFAQTPRGAGENLTQDRTGGRVTQPIMQRPDPNMERVANMNDISEMVTRLAGSQSTLANSVSRLAERVNSGDRTLRAADLTRIINQVNELPRTESRKMLLAELYDLRNEVNNR